MTYKEKLHTNFKLIKMLNQDQSDHPFTKKEFDEMNFGEKILRVAEGIIPPEGKSEEKALADLLACMEKQPAMENLPTGMGKQPATKIRILPRTFRAAAAVIFIILGFYTITTVLGRESIRTKVAEHSSLTLPDGTGVILNATTKISWDKDSFTGKRTLKLNGEALFDVTKGGSFVIETKNGTVEVLGTRFNVFSRKDEFRVSCLRGKIRVSSDREQQILLPGEEAGLTPAGLTKQTKSDIENAISWTEGIFYFEDKPLVSIFDELERQFNASIRYEGERSRLITVEFSNKSLQEALEVICIPMNLEYEIQANRKIRIFEKR